MKESELYPILATWMKRHFGCFKAAGPVGTKHSRADVVGIRDTGGGNSGEVELIVIEVKRGTEPFATASGQAAGYSVYANRVYLADIRERGFTVDEREIASNLGVGLIKVKGGKAQEVLSSPEHRPISRMWLEMARRLKLFPCRICGTFVEVEGGYKNFAKTDVLEAINNETGLVYWHEELAERKKKMKLTKHGGEDSWERRVICKECVWTLLAPLSATGVNTTQPRTLKR
jgi:hypothetical protein